MSTNESIQFFMRLVKEKHQRVIDAAEALMRALSGEDLNKKKEVAKATLQAAQDLRAIISNNDVPGWLNNSISFLQRFVDGQWTAFDLLSHFIPNKALLETHSWVFQESAETAFDFDSIFEHFKKESRLPDLFNQIVKILEGIEASGEVDSVTMLRSLGKVIATIKRSKDGSYFSLNSAWEFLLSFLKNYMWGELSKVPVLGTALDALEKTIKETNEEMFKLHQQVQEEMNRTVEAEVKFLKNKSEFQFITYDRGGHLLANPTTRQLPDAKV
jgi:hypothetical protein